MSTTCRNCSFPVDGDDVFCGNCGQTVTAVESAGGEAYRAQEQPRPGVSPGPAAGYRGPAAAAYPAAPRAAASARGFVASLFDFGFTSFVTPTVVRVLYVLIMIVLALIGLGSVVVAFALNKLFGIFTLIIAAPLTFFISLALYRIVLELFVVIFRVAEDIHVIRERGDLR
jgi:hypothetical protein